MIYGFLFFSISYEDDNDDSDDGEDGQEYDEKTMKKKVMYQTNVLPKLFLYFITITILHHLIKSL